MRNKIILNRDDDDPVELPSRFELCPQCEGHGTDRGASVECDGGGFTASEWAEQDEDFREGYLRGDYDQPCSECNGQRVVAVVDRDACPPDLLALFDAQQEAAYAVECERWAERRYAGRY